MARSSGSTPFPIVFRPRTAPAAATLPPSFRDPRSKPKIHVSILPQTTRPPALPDEPRADMTATLLQGAALFLAGLAFPSLLRFLWSFSPTHELYGSEAVLLNLEIPSLWNNMGYWLAPTDTFRDACAALARRVGRGVRMGEGDKVVDVGSGNGDSLRMWKEEFGVEEVRGFTSMKEQNDAAEELLRTANLEASVSSRCGDGAVCLRQLASASVDVVCSIDAAYHFSPRDSFLRDAFTALRPGGRLGLTDLLRSPSLPLLSRLLLRLICTIAHVPWQNLEPPVEYVARLSAAGFIDIVVDDLSPLVFRPLARYIREKDKKYGRSFGREWGGLVGFARVLEWWAEGSKVRFVVVTASKPAAPDPPRAF